MENDTSKQPGRGCIMSADHVYSQNEEFFRDYDDAAQAAHHNEQLIQQQREERKMAYEPKDNSIALFKNDYRKKETDPEMTGKGLIGGVEYRVAAWKNVSKSGKPYLGLKFSLPRDMGSSFPKSEPEPQPEEDFPF